MPHRATSQSIEEFGTAVAISGSGNVLAVTYYYETDHALARYGEVYP
jgi:hypothetical protein